MKILRDIAQTTQENQIKGTTQLTDLQESVNFINEKFQEYERDRREKEREIKELKENISTLSKRLDDLDSVIDRQEQYSRRNCLLLHGIEEESNENTDQCVTLKCYVNLWVRQYLFKMLIELIDCLEKSQTGNQGQ